MSITLVHSRCVCVRACVCVCARVCACACGSLSSTNSSFHIYHIYFWQILFIATLFQGKTYFNFLSSLIAKLQFILLYLTAWRGLLSLTLKGAVVSTLCGIHVYIRRNVRTANIYIPPFTSWQTWGQRDVLGFCMSDGCWEQVRTCTTDKILKYICVELLRRLWASTTG